jgi:hypothetical protein
MPKINDGIANNSISNFHGKYNTLRYLLQTNVASKRSSSYGTY